jgi:hypothetical protein
MERDPVAVLPEMWVDSARLKKNFSRVLRIFSTSLQRHQHLDRAGTALQRPH